MQKQESGHAKRMAARMTLSIPWAARSRPCYRFLLNLYCTPTEMAKLTSVWVILDP